MCIIKTYACFLLYKEAVWYSTTIRYNYQIPKQFERNYFTAHLQVRFQYT